MSVSSPNGIQQFNNLTTTSKTHRLLPTFIPFSRSTQEGPRRSTLEEECIYNYCVSILYNRFIWPLGWPSYASLQRCGGLRHRLLCGRVADALVRICFRHGPYGHKPHLPTDRQRSPGNRHHWRSDGASNEALRFLLEYPRRPTPARPALGTPAVLRYHQVPKHSRLPRLRPFLPVPFCGPVVRLCRLPPLDRYHSLRYPARNRSVQSTSNPEEAQNPP